MSKAVWAALRAGQQKTRPNTALEMKKVEMLQAKNPEKPATWMRRDKRATWLAYNRRVDIVLEPAGQQYPRKLIPMMLPMHAFSGPARNPA